MILSILIAISLVTSLCGLVMVNKVGNYENIYGAMLFYGAIATVILALASVVLFVLSLL